MKSKKKWVIAFSIVSVIAVAAIISLITVLAAFTTSTNSEFNVTFTAAPNVEAKITAGYGRAFHYDMTASDVKGWGETLGTNDSSTDAQNKAIIFSADVDEEATQNTKHFNKIEMELKDFKEDEYFFVRYTVEDLGTNGNLVVTLSGLQDFYYGNYSNNIDMYLYQVEMQESSMLVLGERTSLGTSSISYDFETDGIDGELTFFLGFKPKVLTKNASVTGSINISLSVES